MKAFTDIEQSKKLASILPLESADMMWDDWSLIDEGWKLSVGYYPEIEKDYGRKCYPAWSLAALLEVIREKAGCDLSIWEKGYNIDVYDLESGKAIAELYSNPIDAAVETIYKLKENNLL